MPDVADHKRQIDSNNRFLYISTNRLTIRFFPFLKRLGFSPTKFPDWAITVMFYTCLHCVDMYLARSAIHPTSHSRRDKEVANNAALNPIFVHYKWLSDKSRTARYDCQLLNGNDVYEAYTRLTNVKKLVAGLM